jgi:hypothetical protein
MTTTIGGSYPAVNSDSDATINGLTVGKGAGSIATNTTIGANTLAANTTGARNTAIGGGAGASNTTGNGLTALGYNTLANNTTGNGNIAIGGSDVTYAGALQANTTGSYNTAIGVAALSANTSGGTNTAVGYQAGYGSTGGSSTMVGYQAGSAGNTQTICAIGYQSLWSSTTGNANTAVGDYQVMYSNTTGASNVAVGRQALYSNTTGGYSTVIGYQAGYTGTTANNNTLVGAFSGYSLTTGATNTFIGANSVAGASGYYVTTGSNNTILGGYTGNQGGLDIRTSSNFIVLSDGAGNPNLSCNDSLWSLGMGTKNNDGLVAFQATSGANFGPVLIGRTGTLNSTTSRWYVGSNSWIKGGTAYDTLTCAAGAAASGGVQLSSGATSWASASDERLKNVTGTYTNALADIAQIKPVKFTWKSDTENKPQVGVIAQSVIGVVPEAVDSDVRASKEDETEYMSVRYTELIPLMIASIQELKAEVDSLKQQLGK